MASRATTFINERDTRRELFVIASSYAFVFCGAWNDGLVGFSPSIWSRNLELFFAFALAVEIVLRAHDRSHARRFDVPPRRARVIRGRATHSRARSARFSRKNPMYLVLLYPVVVPLFAAVVFALERTMPDSTIHNYFEALGVCFALR